MPEYVNYTPSQQHQVPEEASGKHLSWASQGEFHATGSECSHETLWKQRRELEAV